MADLRRPCAVWCLTGMTLLMAACGEPETVVVKAPIRPVKTVVLEEAAGLQRQFPATIESSRRVELAFRVPGKLASLSVAEGDVVKAGQVLATLDPTDFKLALDAARAELDRTRADWERGKVLVKDGHLSRSDYDALESAYRQAVAADEQASLDLAYTELKAPIDGTIAKRHIQNFEEVEAKQEVFAFRDNSELEVRVNIPERLMMRLALDNNPPDEALWVSFPAANEERYPLQVKELATRADEATKTFEARMTFKAPENLSVFPGMSALVVADLSELFAGDLAVELPASALDRRSGEPRLWVYQPDTGKAVPRTVEVGPVVGGKVEIKSGVDFGDRVITAGAEYVDETIGLYEIQVVEQAEQH